MRLKFTLLFLLVFVYTAQSQNLTGIWRGYFSSSNGVYREGIRTEMYKYEVQIIQNKDNSIKGVTYSYKTTVFYGKASLLGIYSPKIKSITFKETSLMELKIGDQSQPCLMTCYLDYSKMDKLEVLQGTFMSVNIRDKGDCGAGKVYLEKVPESDFKKEDFLNMKKSIDSVKVNNPEVPVPKINGTPKTAAPASVNAKKPANTNNPNTKSNPALPKTTTVKPISPTGKTPQATTNIQKTKPGAESNLVSKTNPTPLNPTESKTQPIQSTPITKDTIPNKPKELAINKAGLPRVLVDRENNLVKTIQTDEEIIQIDLYDNGTIDHDSISVFHNNKQVIKNGGLSYTPISLKIKCSKTEAHHELIMVAENLGEIPPNTALMVITAGKKRYEIFLTSTEQRNAKVVLDFKSKE